MPIKSIRYGLCDLACFLFSNLISPVVCGNVWLSSNDAGKNIVFLFDHFNSVRCILRFPFSIFLFSDSSNFRQRQKSLNPYKSHKTKKIDRIQREDYKYSTSLQQKQQQQQKTPKSTHLLFHFKCHLLFCFKRCHTWKLIFLIHSIAFHLRLPKV